MVIEGGVSEWNFTSFGDTISNINKVISYGEETLDSANRVKNLVNGTQMLLGTDDGRDGYTSSGYSPLPSLIPTDTTVAQDEQNTLIKWLIGGIVLVSAILGISAVAGKGK